MSASHAGASVDQLSQASLDLIPVPVFVATVPGGTLVRCNSRAAELCGGGPPVHDRLGDLLHGAGPDEAPLPPDEDPVIAAVLHGRPLRDADAVLHVLGGTLPVSASIEPLQEADGRITATIAICHDTTRWRTAEAERRRSEQRLAQVLSAGRLGAWELDLDTRELIASAQCKANHGFGADEELRLEADILPVVDPEYREQFRTALDDAAERGGSFEIEVPNTWRDGSRHWLFVAGQVVAPSTMVGVSQDVTARHDTEQALREAQRALLDANRRKDEFLGLLGHELRNPMAAVLTAVRILQATGPAEPLLARARDTIFRQTVHLWRLVDDLLDVGRIASGKLRLEQRRVELNAIVKQALETCAPLMEERQHTVEAVLPERPIHLHADASRILQVACNLLTNAAKYTRKGGTIRVTVAEEERFAVIRVRDDGVGIPAEMLGSIFEPYVQVGSSHHRSEGGLGIGLALVKAVVDLHGGTVEARSGGIATGSEFIVRLPAAP